MLLIYFVYYFLFPWQRLQLGLNEKHDTQKGVAMCAIQIECTINVMTSVLEVL